MRLLPLYRGPMDQDIPESFGYRYPFRCATCGPIQEIHTIETRRPSETDLSDLGDGYDYCPNCGSTDVSENDDPKPFRAVRRRRIHSHQLETAA